MKTKRDWHGYLRAIVHSIAANVAHFVASGKHVGPGSKLCPACWRALALHLVHVSHALDCPGSAEIEAKHTPPPQTVN